MGEPKLTLHANGDSWWWNDLTLPRKAQRTNVFIAQTKDAFVKKQVRDKAKNRKFEEMFEPRDLKTKELTDYSAVYNYDLQRNEVKNLKAQKPQNMGWDDPLRGLDNAMLSAPTIVILDYVFAQSHADEIGNHLAAWSYDDTMFAHKSTAIVFTDNIGLFPPTIREFCHSFIIPASTEEERWQTGKATAKKISLAYQSGLKRALDKGDITEADFERRISEAIKIDDSMTEELVKASRGLNCQQLETALMLGILKEREFKLQYITNTKIDIIKTLGLTYIEPNTPSNHVGGYQFWKDYFYETMVKPLRNPQLAAHYGIEPLEGVILYGPPGTGKSLFARMIATEVGLPMINLNSSDFMSKYVGETEQQLRKIFSALDDFSPVIVFCDEIDALLPDRDRIGMGDSGVSSRVINMTLEALGKKRSWILIGASNYIGRMDKAAVRAGRVREIIPVFLPDAHARVAIWNVHTTIVRKIPLAEDVDKQKIADLTWMWNGAEIEQLAKDSAYNGFKENTGNVTMEHVLKAIKDHKVNIEARQENISQVVRDLKNTQRFNNSFVNMAIQSMTKEENEENKSRMDAIVEELIKP